VKSAAVKSRLGTRGRPEESRAAILQAAVGEFSREGVAGARTDAIARSARVNKALLYSYFKDNEALYGAVLDQVFGGLAQAIQHALSQNLPPREKLLAYVGAHFDYIASHPQYPPIVQGEMSRAGRGRSGQFERIARQYFQPLFSRVGALIEQGIAAGEFSPVDPKDFIPSMIAVIVFYFSSAPVFRMISGTDPMSPARIAERREAVLDFISAALFPQRDQRLQGGRK
jgi:TetR/AcrR family transcriptional regulator